MEGRIVRVLDAGGAAQGSCQKGINDPSVPGQPSLLLTLSLFIRIVTPVLTPSCVPFIRHVVYPPWCCTRFGDHAADPRRPAPTAKQLSAADMKSRAEALGAQMDEDFQRVTRLRELTKKKKDVMKPTTSTTSSSTSRRR